MLSTSKYVKIPMYLILKETDVKRGYQTDNPTDRKNTVQVRGSNSPNCAGTRNPRQHQPQPPLQGERAGIKTEGQGSISRTLPKAQGQCELLRAALRLASPDHQPQRKEPHLPVWGSEEFFFLSRKILLWVKVTKDVANKNHGLRANPKY